MLDIEDWTYRTFDDVHLYGSPTTDLSVCCPMCEKRGNDADIKYHMNISLNKQSVHCFRCSYSTSWIGLVMAVMHVPYHQALSELYKIPKMRDFKSKFGVNVVDLAKHETRLPNDYIPLVSADESYHAYRNYMHSRGFDDAVLWDYNIGVAPSIQGRIIIPIEDSYWQGRAIYNWLKPKYLNPKVEARHHIFNSKALKLYDEVVICEGAFSAMAVGRNAIGLIGKETPGEKLVRLVESEVSTFIIALEMNAWQTVGKLADVLHRSGKDVVIWKFTKGDPADPVNDFTVMKYNTMTRVMLSLSM